MRELRGTTLEAAAAAKARALGAQWQRLRPALVDMLRRVGAAGEPSFEDFLWAYSVFWSRGQSLPVPVRDEPPAGGSSGGAGGSEGEEPEGEQLEGSGGGGGGGGGGGTGTGKRQRASGGALRVEVWEGVVPGLDFANHSVQVGLSAGAARTCWLWLCLCLLTSVWVFGGAASACLGA
jgi:hypothetical protein